MFKQYLWYFIGIAWLISLATSNVATWKVHSWKDGADATHAYQVMQDEINKKLKQLSQDMKDSSSDSDALGKKIDLFKTTADALEEGFRHDKAAKPAVAGCFNPFTIDWVHDLNTGTPDSGP